MTRRRRIVCFILSIGFVLSFTGCTGKWGSIKPDVKVTASFEKFQVDSDMEYFISGGDDYPTSILGLSKKYTLGTDLWKKIETKPEIFSYLITNMRAQLMANCSQNQHGFTILDNDGRQIGVWYSMISGNILVQIKDENKVLIHPPADTVDYKRYEGRLGIR